MANSLKREVIVLDTVGATSAITKPVKIKCLVWSGGANNNTCVIHDKASGNILFSLKATTGSETIVIPFGDGIWVDGIYLTTLGGGTVTIYST